MREREDFRGTANGLVVLGLMARYAKPTEVTEVQMSSFDPGWFVQRVVALWTAGGYPKMDAEGVEGSG
jgi:hypothetical protein